MLILKKIVKISLLFIGISITSAILAHLFNDILFDKFKNPNLSVKEHWFHAAPLTAIILLFHLSLKNFTYWYSLASMPKQVLYCAAFGFVIMLYIGLSTFGLNIAGVIYFLLSFILTNSFIPYFDTVLNGKFGLGYETT